MKNSMERRLPFAMLKVLLVTGFLGIGSSFQTKTTQFRRSSVQSLNDFQFVATRPVKEGSGTELKSSLLSTAVTNLDIFFQTSPYTAAALTCGFKASAADLVAQKRQFKKRTDALQEDGALQEIIELEQESHDTDYQRNMAYLMYGAIYQGACQEYIYNHVYPVWFGVDTDIHTVLVKVLFDLMVQTTLITLPVAYLSKAVIYKYSFQEAFTRYIDDIRNHGLLKKYVALWGPVQCLTFSVVPEHWRVTFIACVSFFWLIILSSIASNKPVEAPIVDDECCLEDGQTCNIDG